MLSVQRRISNKPSKNISEDFNSNDASVCEDDDAEILSSESEVKLLEDADT